MSGTHEEASTVSRKSPYSGWAVPYLTSTSDGLFSVEPDGVFQLEALRVQRQQDAPAALEI